MPIFLLVYHSYVRYHYVVLTSDFISFLAVSIVCSLHAFFIITFVTHSL